MVVLRPWLPPPPPVTWCSARTETSTACTSWWKISTTPSSSAMDSTPRARSSRPSTGSTATCAPARPPRRPAPTRRTGIGAGGPAPKAGTQTVAARTLLPLMRTLLLCCSRRTVPAPSRCQGVGPIAAHRARPHPPTRSVPVHQQDEGERRREQRQWGAPRSSAVAL